MDLLSTLSPAWGHLSFLVTEYFFWDLVSKSCSSFSQHKLTQFVYILVGGHVFPNAYLGRPQFALSLDRVGCTVSGLWEWRPQGLVVRAEETCELGGSLFASVPLLCPL